MEGFDGWVERARAVRLEDEISRRGIVLKRVGAEHVGPCPVCGGEDRFAINGAKAVWNCRGCGVGGDVIKLVEVLDNVDFIAACTNLAGEPPPKPNGKDHGGEVRQIVAAEFAYEAEDGGIAFVVERIEFQNPDGTFVVTANGKRKKTFRQKRPDPDLPGRWLWNVDGVSLIPYRLPQLIEGVADDRLVFVCEGEKCADALRGLGLTATTNAMGAGKWRPELGRFFSGADVVLTPDNDDTGLKHIQEVGAALSGIARRCRVLLLPGLPAKGDICDWLAAGGTREAFDKLAVQAPEWRPLAEADKPNEAAMAKGKAAEDALIEALAKLPPGIEFAKQRKKAARQLGVSRSDIDAELEARRDREAAPLHGWWIVEPWPEPVDGDSLLRDIIRCLHRYIVFSHDDALAMALWIVFSWVADAATHSPMLCLTSAEPNSGKTTGLAVLSFLVPRAIRSVEISEAALYRSIEQFRPTLIIDEFDSVLANKDKDALRSVITDQFIC